MNNPEIIKNMPDKETLEAFVEGLHGVPKVMFNLEKKEFEWIFPRPKPPVEQPKP